MTYGNELFELRRPEHTSAVGAPVRSRFIVLDCRDWELEQEEQGRAVV